MRAVVLTALAGVLAIFVVASPKPASAAAATIAPALNPSHAQTADLVEVGRYYKRRRYYRRPYYRPYRYYRRPYYRSYRYRPYYGRRYYYGRPYYRPYRYRRGVSVYVGI